jgi:actin related protein 2/3 complex subunit 1A/1B
MEAAFQSSISAHCFNASNDQLAICPNIPEIWIFSVKSEDPKTWKRTHTLQGHFMLVTDIDWNHKTNAIATSGQDRNAYVWTLQQNQWKPTLVVLRIGRAATSIRWSPSGNKFCVGSGSKQIPVCHYEESQDMWVAKMIKKAGKSTIVSVDWAPNNLFIIAGGSDFKCRVFSAYIQGVDEECKVDDTYETMDPSKVSSFGTVLCEFDQSKGWIESVRFSPSGHFFAFCGHDSSLHFGSFAREDAVQSIQRTGLPFRVMAFLTDTILVAGGYDCVPVIYERDGNEWKNRGKFDTGTYAKKNASSGSGKKKNKNFNSAFAKFQKSDRLGGASQGSDTILPSRHQNMITDIRVRSETDFTTSSVDGRVLFWNITKPY